MTKFDRVGDAVTSEAVMEERVAGAPGEWQEPQRNRRIEDALAGLAKLRP
jgi:hypothetical protein